MVHNPSALASNALIGLVGNPVDFFSEGADHAARFQCVNWISWKLDDPPGDHHLEGAARFQCVNWISWKLRTNLACLATRRTRFQCVNWICWKPHHRHGGGEFI